MAMILAVAPSGLGSVDDAQAFALQAADPYIKEGFQVREDYWGGDLAAGEKKAVRQQLQACGSGAAPLELLRKHQEIVFERKRIRGGVVPIH